MLPCSGHSWFRDQGKALAFAGSSGISVASPDREKQVLPVLISRSFGKETVREEPYMPSMASVFFVNLRV